MYSEDTVLRTTTSINIACVGSFDASAKSFKQPAYSVSHKGGNSILIMEYNLRKNDLNSFMNVKVKVKQSRYRPGVAQRVPGT
jgi:hypothetical protein